MVPMKASAVLAVALALVACGDSSSGPRANPAVPLEFVHDPGSPAYVSVAGGRLSVRFRARSGRVDAARIVSGEDTVLMHFQMVADGAAVWRGATNPGLGRYSIEVDTPDSTAVFGPFDPPADPFTSVEWVGGSVGYQIFPERFANGDPTNDSLALATDEYVFRDPSLGRTEPTLSPWDGEVGESHCCHQYFGGDLQGVMDRMDHLESLGVGVVYLNPIFVSGSAHGYDTFDYRRVAPHLGDSTVLRALLDDAHARGIRVIWDFVPNHVGIGHWAFQDAVAQGEASDTWDWFTFRVPADSIRVGDEEDYAAWWNFGSLPELRTDNPDVMEHLLEVATGWTRFGFDGIRVDVAADLNNRAGFFPTWRAAVKAVDPDVYLLGEVWEQDPSWLRGDEFDALMNYPLGQGVVEPFARGEWSATQATAGLAEQYALYPEASVAMAFNLVSSHDNDRLLTKMGGGDLGATASEESRARHRLAAALLYALPGMPVTFQGDECAFLGTSEGRHTARYPMQWDACDPEFLDHYRTLGTLRSAVPALTHPAWRTYRDAGDLLAFYRGEPGPGEVLAAFNNTGVDAVLALPGGTWTDRTSGGEFETDVSVPALGWRVLERN